MRRAFYHMLALLPCLFLAQPPLAAAELTLSDVLQRTLAQHPDLSLSHIGTAMAETDAMRIEGMLDPQVKGAIGYSDEKTPTTSPFAATRTNISRLSGSITKPLQDGSSLTGMLNYNRAELTYPSSVPPTFQSTLNPAYQNQIDLIYRYPLMRGHGNPAYHQSALATENDIAGTRWQTEMIREQLAEQAISRFYQMAANEISLKLAHDAVRRAERLLEYQKMREQFGLIERAEALQAEALLATRKMELAQAAATLQLSRTALNRLMLEAPGNDITVSTDLYDTRIHTPPPLEALMMEATTKRPVFKMLDAQLAANSARLIAAQDTHDAQVDLVGQLGTRALTSTAGKAVGNGLNLNDRFASVSIELSDTIGGNTTRAAIRRAELARQKARIEKEQAMEVLQTTLADLHTQLQTSLLTIDAAEKRATAEKRKFDAEIKRYREGRSNTANIVQFEGELRSAELQAMLQHITAMMAKSRLDLARGILLAPTP